MSNIIISNYYRAVALGGLLAMSGLASAQTTTTTTSTTSAGTVSEFTPGSISIRTDTSTAPVSYSYSKTTTYVDENGAPVSVDVVKSGVPVTVFYSQEGDRLMASKVVVRKVITSEPAPAVIEKKTTTTTTTPAQ